MHVRRNVLAVVPKGNAEMVAAAIRTILAQPDAEHVKEQFDVIAGLLGRQLPKVESMFREAKADLLAFTSFPQVHWRQICSANPLKWDSREFNRRTDVVGVFPNPEALCDSQVLSWSNSTTNGPPPTGATAASDPRPW